MRFHLDKNSILPLLLWISGSLWLLSWIGMAFEIFYWHHITPSLRLNPPPQIPGLPPPKPGEFLITVIASSIIAPPVFLALVLFVWIRRKIHHSNNQENKLSD
jgi:hypothetical protein